MNEEVYYQDYKTTGLHLGSMVNAIKKIGIPINDLGDFQNKQKIKFLLMGSSTEHNLEQMAILEKEIRPKQAKNDTVLIMDLNQYPLLRHQDWLQNFQQNHNGSNADVLEYPKFHLLRGDMIQSPIPNNTIDVVISHYTLNFIEDIKLVSKAISEFARVLKKDGLLLLALQSWTPWTKPYLVKDTPNRDYVTGSYIYQFTPMTYLKLLTEHGFNLVAENNTGMLDMSCGIFSKEPS